MPAIALPSHTTVQISAGIKQMKPGLRSDCRQGGLGVLHTGFAKSFHAIADSLAMLLSAVFDFCQGRATGSEHLQEQPESYDSRRRPGIRLLEQYYCGVGCVLQT
jgi:hypothetical protein